MMVQCACSLKAMLIILFCLTTGLRLSDIRALKIGNVYSSNPLFHSLSLLEQLQKKVKNPIIVICQEMKDVIPNACKCGIEYYVFLPEFVTILLDNYLQERLTKYKHLDPEEFLFPSESRSLPWEKRLTTPISEREIDYLIKKAARVAGVRSWKKVSNRKLRSLFYHTLGTQPMESKIMDDDREFFMGHTIVKPRENYFCFSMIDDMRKKYSQLKFTPEEISQSSYFLRTLARRHGINYEFARSIAQETYGENPSEEEIGKIVDTLIGQQKEYITVTKEYLCERLKDGYRVELVFPDGEILMSKQTFTSEKTKEDDEKPTGSVSGIGDLDSLKVRYDAWVKTMRQKKKGTEQKRFDT